MRAAWQVAVRWALVGDGGHVARRTSHWWEVVVAAREHRRPAPLYHCALELTRDSRTWVLELAPTWGRAAQGRREVVAAGPVGSPWLGRWPLFRYEVRYTAGPGSDSAAIDVVELGRVAVDAVDAAVERVPLLTWGRRAGPARDLWTSNSVVSWVLAETGLLGTVGPPAGGRAPGWDAGIALGVTSSG